MASKPIIPWTPEQAKLILRQRLTDCIEDRKKYEDRWRSNEYTLYNTGGQNLDELRGTNLEKQFMTNGLGGLVQDSLYSGSVGINYAFKNLRFIHAQMAANPPSVVPKPTSSDRENRERADAANQVLNYGRKQYNLQEISDRRNLYTLTYGTGFTKSRWNPDGGRPIDVNKETGVITMEGDFERTVPDIWDIYLDPNARQVESLRYYFEKITIPWDEAIARWPGEANEKLLQKFRKNDKGQSQMEGGEGSAFERGRYDVVELYEYWEKGLLENGYLGRFCLCSRNGDLFSSVMPNPERYADISPMIKSEEEKGIAVAILPIHIMTDIDVPGRVWGKSCIEYVVAIQDNLNRLDNATLDNVKIHGVARLITFEGSEINKEGSVVTTPTETILVAGNQAPKYIEPMPTPDIVPVLLARYKQGTDDMMGVNEAMMGQQSRETSGYSMQYSVNQGNIIRFRLFNKYRAVTEEEAKSFLRIVSNKWETGRIICVAGKEKSFLAKRIKGVDIDSGYALSVDYGSDFSLDPATKRDEILAISPLLEKAGLDFKLIVQQLKLHDISGLYDNLDYPKDRQQEIFTEMVTKGIYIPPIPGQNNLGMLAYANEYVMTAEFNDLDGPKYRFRNDGPLKSLIMRHIQERSALLNNQGQPQSGAPAGIPPTLPPLETGVTPSNASNISNLLGPTAIPTK